MRMFVFYQKVTFLLLSLSVPLACLLPSPVSAAESVRTAEQGGVTVTGIVRDAGSQPMAGAMVYSLEYNIATMTDAEGRYSITVPKTGVEIQVSFIGYKTFTFTVGTSSVQNVVLEDENTTLDDVVVVAYGTQRKATVTGSVSAVTTKDLLQSPQANISNALAGRMPGLLSVQRSGEPGNDASTLRIRGIGTFAGDQDPLIMVDGIETDNYNNIDPNEIESITILKDASATAVYGVRGANGVLLIQTKRGELGKPKVSLSTNTAFTTFPFLRENMNSYEWASGYNQAYAYDSYISGSYTPAYEPDEIAHYQTGDSPILYPDIDWYDYMLKDYSMQTQSNINISGGSRRVKYFFSLGYFTQDGMLNTDVVKQDYDYQIKYRRYNFRSNFDINITRDLTASIDMSMQIDNKRGPNWSTGLLFDQLSSVPSNASPGVIDGKIITLQKVTNSSWSPLTAYNKGWHNDYGNTLNGSVRLNYDMGWFLKGLKLRAAISYQSYNVEMKTFEKEQITYDARPTEDGDIIYVPNGEPKAAKSGSSVSRNRRMYIEGGIEWNNTFNRHSVGALILYNQSKYHSPDLAFLIPNGYQGVVGRVTYDYDGRYLAEFNIGYNGTENFAEGRRFGWFPSFSLGWVLTDEPFFPENNALTFFKVRASYGVVGNDKVGGDRFLYVPTSYTFKDGVYNFGEVGTTYQSYKGSYEGKIGNPLLTWEKAKKLNVGIDAHFLKEKLALTVEWFLENRDNILTNRGTIPAIIGANMPAYNLGRMRNTGYEGELSYNDRWGEFRFFAKGNFTYAHNTILEQDEMHWPWAYQYRTGHRYGQFFGYVAEGLFNTWEEVNDVNRPVYQWNDNKMQPGDIKYKDVNGDGYINDQDIVPIGYSNFPEIMFGLSLGGSWKGLDFSILFQGATNVSTQPSRRTMRGFYTGTGASKDLLKSWSYERYTSGQEIVYPRYSVTNDTHNYVTSTYWIEDATYVRLKSAEIGYTMTAGWLSKAGISSVRLYLNGNNLLTFCNLFPGEDPEYPTMEANSEPYPLTRVYNIGLNINF